MQLLLCTRYVANISRNTHLHKICMDVNSVEVIVTSHKVKVGIWNPDYKLLGEIFIDLFSFCNWTWRVFHHLFPPSSPVHPHWTFTLLTSLWAPHKPCVFSPSIFLFPVCPAFHRKKIITVGQTFELEIKYLCGKKKDKLCILILVCFSYSVCQILFWKMAFIRKKLLYQLWAASSDERGFIHLRMVC